jgi:Asp-tRNA(Asn)/Glu-tRNA(Gln) amidotransferase A subunit family amidase
MLRRAMHTRRFLTVNREPRTHDRLLALSLVFALAGCGAESTAAPSAPSTTSASRSASATPAASSTATAGQASAPLPFPLDATIPELQEAMEAGDLTAVELVDFYLARIAAYDDTGPSLNAFILVNPNAHGAAAALDAERAASGSRGMLHGIPVIIKDNLNTFDMQTTAGSTDLRGWEPGDDAFVVHRLREAGAIILGKSNTPDWAGSWQTVSSLDGQTLSPYDLTRDPGGSSGGTAVAVTANFGVAGLGTDTCGSIRLPTAHNNLYGLRPSSGLVSRGGLIPLSLTLDAIGPISRSPVDLAIMLDAIAGKDPNDPSTVAIRTSYLASVTADGLQGRRIGVDLHPAPTGAVAVVFDAALDELTASGVDLVEISIPKTPPQSDLGAFMEPEEKAALNAYFSKYPDPPIEVEPGPPLDTIRHRAAIEGRGAYRTAVTDLMDEYRLDAIVYPGAKVLATPIGTGSEPFDCQSASVGGLPAIVMPAGFSPGGLPVAIELMGRQFDEATLIAMAAGWEAHTDHRMLPPTTPALGASD